MRPLSAWMALAEGNVLDNLRLVTLWYQFRGGAQGRRGTRRRRMRSWWRRSRHHRHMGARRRGNMACDPCAPSLCPLCPLCPLALWRQDGPKKAPKQA